MIFPRSLICASSFPIYIETSKADDGVLRVRLRELEEEDARVQWGAGWPGLRPNPKNPTLAHKAARVGHPGAPVSWLGLTLGCLVSACARAGDFWRHSLSFSPLLTTENLAGRVP